MKSQKILHGLIRGLVALLGAGIGAAVVLAILNLVHFSDPDKVIPLGILVALFAGFCLLFAGILFLFSERIIATLKKAFSTVVDILDSIPAQQLVPAIGGLVIGLVIAALLCGILGRMGESIFTTALAAILYLCLGLLGYTVGLRRGEELTRHWFPRLRTETGRILRSQKGRGSTRGEKILDTSVLMDGRVADISREGFLDGVLVLPAFVRAELERTAASEDPVRRGKGKRGLEMLAQLEEERGEAGYRIDTEDWPEETDTGVKLLRLATQRRASLLTGDLNLARAARIAGIRALSVDRLAAALRPALVAGEVVELDVLKEGKGASQGVGYLPDGTMVVVEGARQYLGSRVQAQVTSVLQTSAGRMIFARLAENADAANA